MSNFKEVRCKGCGKLLGEFYGAGRIKCTKTECGGMNEFDTRSGIHRFVPKPEYNMLKKRSTSSGTRFH